MNDLLNNLLDRTIEDARTIRPRLPSVFESPTGNPVIAPAAGFLGAESLEVSRERDATADPWPGPLRSTSNSETKRAHRIDERSELNEVTMDHAGPGLPVKARTPRRRSADSREMVVEEEEVVRQIFQNTTRPLNQVDDEASLTRPLRPPVESPTLAPQSPADRVMSERDFNSATARKGSVQVEARVLEPSSPAKSRAEPESFETREHIVEAERAAIQPIMRPRLDREDYPMPQLQVGLSPLTEQIVNVTIGRVEVRASMATGAAKPVLKQEPPAMSLHEYLRQRGGPEGGSGT